MKKSIIVDVDIISEYLKTGKGPLPKAYDEYKMHIPTIIHTEILASKTFDDESLIEEVVEFLKKYFDTINTEDVKVAQEAARIIRSYQINLAAAYIAATCIVKDMPLLTDNRKDFESIEGISFVDM